MRTFLFTALAGAMALTIPTADANSQRVADKDKERAEKITLASNFVQVEEAWMREHLRVALKNAAGYMTIKNVSDMEVTLQGVNSNIAETTEVHQMTMEDGIMRMFEVENLTIPAGESLVLEPGGKHIMFIGMKGKVTQDDTPQITLHFKDMAPMDIPLEVEPFRTRRGHKHH